MSTWLFGRGHAADFILLIMAAECAWLVLRRRWPIRAAVYRLLPGGLMIIALRFALTGIAWPWIGLALAASFPAHLADLATGWGRFLKR